MKGRLGRGARPVTAPSFCVTQARPPRILCISKSSRMGTWWSSPRRELHGSAITRKFIPATSSAGQTNQGKETTIMTYNILAETYGTPTHHEQCRLDHLVWEYREERILKEISTVAPDVLCLQELDHYKEFKEALSKVGYASVHKARGKLPSLMGKETDSCAIFYNANRYALVESATILLDHVALQDAITRHFPNPNDFIRSNVGLLVSLEEKETKKKLVVGTAHLFWNPEFTFVKMAQAAFLIDQFSSFLQKHPTANYCLTGDFNSLPHSAVYSYITNGRLGDHSERALFPSFSFTHQLAFCSAYAALQDPITNWTIKFKGCLDYIFCPRDAELIEVLEPITETSAALQQSQCASPNEWMPSDHIPLAVKLRLK